MLKFAVHVVTLAIGLRLANAGIDYVLDKGAQAIARAGQPSQGQPSQATAAKA